MEVGAVKQAFNNEVILLKKNLNQAKTQVIHKLTRKAKTLIEKKSPDHLKEKLKRKAESAVNEVLIIKKIKARDMAKFIITHTGNVSDYINKPKVDNDKACARLVLHKALQDKYKFIRNRFGNIPIKDLFMSRQERRKLKKEAKEQQKNKKKGKEGKVVNTAGDWDVEDVEMGDGGDVSEKEIGGDDNVASQIQIGSDDNDEISGDEHNGDESQHSEVGITRSDDDDDSDIEQQDVQNSDENVDNLSTGHGRSDDEATLSDEGDDEIDNKSEDEEIGNLIKLKPETMEQKPMDKSNLPKSSIDKIATVFDDLITKKQIKVKENNTNKKVKDSKNKNLKDKLQNRKFKKDYNNDHLEGRKIVDPFFITATGGNYLSLAEPRQPDEIKEVHKQGNRQERRAAMFGRKFKPRNEFRDSNFRPNKFDEGNNRNTGGRNKNDRFGNGEEFNRNSKFNERNDKFNDKNDGFTSNNVNNQRNDDKKEEKLHPSWEAKRKLKSMSLLPSQGKKIVFEN